MCICVQYTCLCMHMWRPEIDIAYLYHTPPRFFETSLSLNLELAVVVKLGPEHLRELHVPIPTQLLESF